MRAGRAHALMHGNGYVTPDDIKAVAPAVLRHRLVLDPEVELEGQAADDLLEGILSRIEAPRR